MHLFIHYVIPVITTLHETMIDDREIFQRFIQQIAAAISTSSKWSSQLLQVAQRVCLELGWVFVIRDVDGL